MSNVPYIFGRNGITVFIDGYTHTVPASAANFSDMRNAIKNIATTTVEDFKRILNIRLYISQLTEGRAEIVDGKLYFDGKPMNGAIAERVAEMFAEGFGFLPLLKFLNRVASNPRLDKDSPIYYPQFEDELYLFLASGNCPITEDGKILAYKMIRENYMDIYTGTMDNSPGKEVKLPNGPEDVDPNRLNTCARGLHFASLEYITKSGYGNGNPNNRLVVLEIDPAAVISIPDDYNNSKGRAWRYDVLREIELTDRIRANFITSNQVDSWNEPESWDIEDVEDDEEDDYLEEDEDVVDDEDMSDEDEDFVQEVYEVCHAVDHAPTVPALLTDKEVVAILEHLAKKDPVAAIARLYGVSARTIARIRDNETYTWIKR